MSTNEDTAAISPTTGNQAPSAPAPKADTRTPEQAGLDHESNLKQKQDRERKTDEQIQAERKAAAERAMADAIAAIQREYKDVLPEQPKADPDAPIVLTAEQKRIAELEAQLAAARKAAQESAEQKRLKALEPAMRIWRKKYDPAFKAWTTAQKAADKLRAELDIIEAADPRKIGQPAQKQSTGTAGKRQGNTNRESTGQAWDWTIQLTAAQAAMLVSRPGHGISVTGTTGRFQTKASDYRHARWHAGLDAKDALGNTFDKGVNVIALVQK